MGTAPAARFRPEGRIWVLAPDLLPALHLALHNSFYLLGHPFLTYTQGAILQWVSCSLIFET